MFRAYARRTTTRWNGTATSAMPSAGPSAKSSLTGGVGGTRAGVKCLHAHYADTAAGNTNPVGVWTAEQIEPLDCTATCVAFTDGSWSRNPAWTEPR